MKKTVTAGLISGVILSVSAQMAPGIIMEVDGVPVPSSEFEYLYLKNNRQQLEPQTFDEYVELFKVYRLKVADAKAMGKDTTDSFRKEMAQYRRELLQPYITDSTYFYTLVDIAAARDREEVEATHIMMAKTQDSQTDTRNKEILDSLRQEIIKGAQMTDLAPLYSQDRTVSKNNGYLGYIPAGRYPYAFETAVYETPEGEISEIIDSGVGYHIVMPGKRRPSRGRVDVAHIMKIAARGVEEEFVAQQKQVIDSIRNLAVANPETFGELAIANSDDKGTARNAGKLPMFGVGEMVPEFEEVAFSLADGEISEPFRSLYGWHIIKRYGSKPHKDYSEVKADVERKISNPQDPRYSEMENHKYQLLAQRHPEVKGEQGTDGYKEALLIAEEENQYANNEEYRHLIDEYTDGSMLFEASKDMVFDKAQNDTVGLEKYFKKHKKNYKFPQRMAKGILIQAKNDSVAELVKDQVRGLGRDEIVAYVKANFKGEATADKFLIGQGVNGMIDNIMFGDEPVKPKAKGYETYFILEGKILDTPEEMADVRNHVTTDYQEELEKQWVAKLKKRYKVNVNKQELSEIKKRSETQEAN